MKPITTDVLVCGGGISGLLTVRSLLNLGLSVACVEKRKGGLGSKELLEDGRSTALLKPSTDFLGDLGLWPSLSSKAQPLESLIICNMDPEKNIIDETCEFSAEDLGLQCLGFNIPNDVLKNQLKKSLESENKFLFLDDVLIEDITPRSQEIVATTNKQHKITSKLLIGADGRNSTIRQLAQIGKYGIDYSQQALVFSIIHELQHKAKSFEIYESGGPCTLVPNKTTHSDGHFSSVVLMQRPREVQKLLQLNRAEMSSFISKRTGSLLGKCEIQTKVKKFPVISQISRKFTGDRLLLLAESAHVMPPIGAQGLNSSIQDIQSLTEFISHQKVIKEDFGHANFLASFERARVNQIRSRMAGIHILNKVSMYGCGMSSEIRKLGLRTLKKNLKVRKFVMNLGMYEKFRPS